MIVRATGPRGSLGVESRAWRNRNPGNLRIRTTKPPVDHVAVDNSPGGPFGIYGSECDGWADLTARILQLYRNGSTTCAQIINVWAPPADHNDTHSYATGVAVALGVHVHDPINPSRLSVMRGLARAIQRQEGKRNDPAWDMGEFEAGLLLGGCGHE